MLHSGLHLCMQDPEYIINETCTCCGVQHVVVFPLLCVQGANIVMSYMCMPCIRNTPLNHIEDNPVEWAKMNEFDKWVRLRELTDVEAADLVDDNRHIRKEAKIRWDAKNTD